MTQRKLLPTADKHVLYEASVQAPDYEVAFFDRLFRRITGAPAQLLREDFCGTAALACAWVKLGRDRKALGVDIDPAPLAWAAANNLPDLTEEQRARLTLAQANVFDLQAPRADLLVALNFSYSVFQTRALLGSYIAHTRRSLRPGGLLLLDAWGGGLTQKHHTDRKRIGGGWTYLWEQAGFDPISHHTLCHIHFEHSSGRRLNKAFSYDWRLWTLPELRELMEEAGYQDIQVLWEGTDRKTNRGNGVFRRVEKAPPDPSWVCYLAGRAPL